MAFGNMFLWSSSCVKHASTGMQTVFRRWSVLYFGVSFLVHTLFRRSVTCFSTVWAHLFVESSEGSPCIWDIPVWWNCWVLVGIISTARRIRRNRRLSLFNPTEGLRGHPGSFHYIWQERRTLNFSNNSLVELFSPMLPVPPAVLIIYRW